MNRSLFALAALAALATPAFAAQESLGLSSAGASWLRLPGSARSLGMADAGAASASRVDELSVNPAALASVNGQQAGFMHNAWLRGTSAENLAWAGPLGPGALAVFGSYIGFGAIDKVGFDSSGNLITGGTINPYAYSFGLGWGQRLRNVDLGVDLKALGENLGSSGASSFAADLGGRAELGLGLSLGAAARHLGGQLNGSSLPSDLRLGAAWSSAALSGQGNDFLIAFDLLGPFADFGASNLSAGLEYRIGGLAAVRAGYRAARSGVGSGSGLNAGLGLSWRGFELDYAYSSYGELGAANQISLLARFGETSMKPAASEPAKPAPKADALEKGAKPATKKAAPKKRD